jgi:hypothetical protein
MVAYPWTSIHSNEGGSDGLQTDAVVEWSAEEAAEHWFPSSATPGPNVIIRNGSGLLWVQTGSFDPLVENPDIPEGLYAMDDPFATGFLIIQLETRNGDLAESVANSVSATIIDTLPEDAWILRLPTGAAERAAAITTLSENPEVRWVGSQHPAWRLHHSLHDVIPGQSIDLDLTPVPDLPNSEVLQLESQLISAGADFARCDNWICQVTGIDSTLLPALARDHRLLFTEPHSPIEIVNNYARSISKIDAVVNHNGGLDGTGEVGSLSDSGLDDDHGDFNNRVRGIYHNFGPDSSAADAHSGHGTHVAAIMLGDGAGDSSVTGMAPGSTFHFYQLEYDQTGQLARWGSLYDMFRHSWQNAARMQTNSWGAQSSYGQYTSDSRSADTFLNDYDDFLVLFAAGNEGSQGSSSVSPPATAKNVLTVGASTTGRPGTSPVGQVASFSSIGPTADGRIKPDIVAPGVQICSARALEAQSPAGWSCSSARHSGTNTPLYMSADGTSAATPVVAGASLLARQFLRQELGISNPDSALIKAVLINGAKDLGTSDIPNMDEGWGQLDLEQSIYPRDGVIAKNIFFDSSQSLSPGHSYVYTYAIDGSFGLDVTMVWNDQEGSASASQSSVRLVNDLDLTVTSPDGTVYKGNDFASGFSTSGGSSDSLNNVERVRLNSGATGDWQIAVSHAGGYSQGYSLVVTAVGNENQMSDLAVYDGSVWASQVTPLENDYVLLRMSWLNQAPKASGDYEVLVEDVTDNVVLWSGTRNSLGGGFSDSFSFQKRFTTTGVHQIRLTLDVTNNVTEMNDEVNGTNNNVGYLDLNVTAIGVRVTPRSEDGSLPTDSSELEIARKRQLDPSTASEISWDLTLLNEGTNQEDIELTVTPVQLLREGGVLDAPQDDWEKFLSATGPFMLNASGGTSDSTNVTVTLRDNDADLSTFKYALPGTYIVDVLAFYRTNPTVSHSVRLELEVLRVEGIQTILAGDVDLGAKPGDFASFSLSVLNTGNGDTVYEISCDTPNRWQIELGSGNSSSLTLEPLARMQFLPVQVRVRVPNIVNGLPAAGTVEDVTCVTSSLVDPTKSTTESPVDGVEVWVSREFSVDLYGTDGSALGPAATAPDTIALNGDQINHSLVIENLGNIEITLEVRASPAQATWAMQMTVGVETDSRVLTLDLSPGEVQTILIEMWVPTNAARGDSNQINFRTERSASEFITNQTRILVDESADFSVILPDSGTINSQIGTAGTATILLENTGNVPLRLDWGVGTLPDEWNLSFITVKPTLLPKAGTVTVTIALTIASGTSSGIADSVIVLIDAETLSGDVQISKTAELGVVVSPSVWIDLQHDLDLQIDVAKSAEVEGNLTVSNFGNSPCSVMLSVESPSNLELTLDRVEWSLFEPGQTAVVSFKLISTGTYRGVENVWINATVTPQSDAGAVSTDAILNVTSASGEEAGGLLGMLESLGLPAWAIVLIVGAIVALLGVGIIRLRGRDTGISKGEELISTGEIIGNQETRRAAALDMGASPNDQTSGAVSQAEIDAALAQSAPQPLPLPALPGMGALPSGLPPSPSILPAGLPPEPVAPIGGPPLPPGGLPDGWTMEQWMHYGKEYLERTGQT